MEIFFSMKVDIAKSFDTPDWNFLIWVLRTFGFNDLFCKWIHTILASSKISISVVVKLWLIFLHNRSPTGGSIISFSFLPCRRNLYYINLRPISSPYMEMFFSSYGIDMWHNNIMEVFCKYSHHIHPRKILSPHSSSQICI